MSDEASAVEASVDRSGRAFTAKALTFGFLGALLVLVGTNFNDNRLFLPYLIGNHLPVGPVILVALAAVLWNPLCGRFLPILRFSVRELAVALCLMLVCCWLPSSGFFRYFHRQVMRPWVDEKAKIEWQRRDLLGELPAAAFPLGGGLERRALEAALAEAAAAGEDPVALRALACVPVRAFGERPGEAWKDAKELLTRRAQADPAWQPALALVEGLPRASLVPTAEDAGPYARAFRTVAASFARRTDPNGSEAKEHERVYSCVASGLVTGDRMLSPGEVPWSAWVGPMLLWLPLIACFSLMSVTLALVVHRQWSRHEQLSYPLAQVCTSLLERGPNSSLSGIMRNPLFWWGVVPVFGLHLINYLNQWFPSKVPAVPLDWAYGTELKTLFPSIVGAPDAGALTGRLFFTVVGVSFFIASEVSLSVGLSAPLLFLLGIQTYAISGQGPDDESLRTGSYFAFAVVMLWAGRSYYKAVCLQAFGLGRDAHPEPVWAARFFLAAFAGFSAILTWGFGVDWVMALLFSGSLMVLFLVLTRIVCETGMPFIQANWYPATFLGNALGIAALGPSALVLLNWLQWVFAADPRECLMPYAATANQVAERQGLGRGRLLGAGLLAQTMTFVAGFAFLTWLIYADGARSDAWADGRVVAALDTASRSVAALADTGQLAASEAASGFSRLALVSTWGHASQLSWMVAGAGLVLLVSLLRFRFAGWPIHPVLFLVWGTYPLKRFWASFLIGYAVKELVVRFGGGRSYQRLKPIFVGLIVGELLAIAVILLAGFIYYSFTGQIPKRIDVLPG